MKPILAACLLLAPAWVATGQTNAAGSEVAPPIRYTRLLQLHEVPVGLKSPNQVQRERDRDRETLRLTIPESALPSIDTPPEMPPPGAPNRPLNKRPPSEERWDKGAEGSQDEKAKKDKDLKPGWGWLAEDVRKAGERRSDEVEKEREVDEEEREQTGPTNRLTLADHAWDSRSGQKDEDRARIRSPQDVRNERPRDGGPARPAPEALAGRELAARTYENESATPREKPPEWMIASAAAVPDSPIGRSILDSLQAPDTRPAQAQGSDWANPGGAGSGLGTLVGSPASPFSSAGGLRPLEPTISAPTRLPSSFGEPISPFQPEAARGAWAGSAFNLAQPAALAPAAPAEGSLRTPSLGGEAAMPGIQTKTLPW